MNDGVPSYKVVNIELNDDGLTVAAAIVHKLQLQVEGVSVFAASAGCAGAQLVVLFIDTIGMLNWWF